MPGIRLRDKAESRAVEDSDDDKAADDDGSDEDDDDDDGMESSIRCIHSLHAS